MIIGLSTFYLRMGSYIENTDEEVKCKHIKSHRRGICLNTLFSFAYRSLYVQDSAQHISLPWHFRYGLDALL